MSIIGTRPPLISETNLYELHHRARLAIKPGITGMWQVSGRSDITDFEEVVRLDKEYITNWNIGLDILMFIFSNQKGETSSKVSNTIAEAMNIESDNKWVEPSVQPLMLGLNLRKYAHIIIYFFMGVSAYYALKESLGLRKRVLF